MIKLKRGGFWPSLLILGFIFVFASCARSSVNQQTVSEMDFLLDTFVQATVFFDANSENNTEYYRQIAQNILTEVRRLEGLFSMFAYGTDIWRINNAQGQAVQVSDETIELLTYALSIREQTNGVFDITMGNLTKLWHTARENQQPPSQQEISNALATINSHIYIDGNYVWLENPDSRIDLGGIAKGYIARVLAAYVSVAALVYLGGDALAIGCKPDGTDWAIGLQDPFGAYREIFAGVFIPYGFVASSGNQHRSFSFNDQLYHHIIDPNTGLPADNNLVSVVVISENKTFADAFATALFVLGLDEGLALAKTLPDIEAIFITSDGDVHKTEGVELVMN